MSRATIVAFVILLMVSNLVSAQKPLATTEVAGKQLELWAFEHLKWMDAKTADHAGASGSVLSLLEDELQQEPNIPWENNAPRSRSRRNHVALGFLLRDKNGKVSPDSIRMSEAHQASIAGQLHSFSERMDKPSDAFCSCKWSFDMLSPLVVVTGDESQPQPSSIDRLSGFVSIHPQVSARLVFTVDELQSKQRKSDGLFSIEPIDSEKLADGTVYRFQMFYPKPDSKGQSLSKQMFLKASSMLPQVTVELKDGAITRPNGQMRFAASRQLQSKIRAAFKSENKILNLLKQSGKSLSNTTWMLICLQSRFPAATLLGSF